MKILVLNTNTVNASEEINTIKYLFPETIVVDIYKPIDVLSADISTDVVHIPTHSDVNLLFLKNGVISGPTIGSIFSDIKLIFLNSCLSKDIANISNISQTISWAHEVYEKDAILFSRLFYTSLQATHKIEKSYEIACNMLRDSGYKNLLPIYYKKNQSNNLDNVNNTTFNFNFNDEVKKVIGQLTK
jgi:hypothetical protein